MLRTLDSRLDVLEGHTLRGILSNGGVLVAAGQLNGQLGHVGLARVGSEHDLFSESRLPRSGSRAAGNQPRLESFHLARRAVESNPSFGDGRATGFQSSVVRRLKRLKEKAKARQPGISRDPGTL